MAICQLRGPGLDVAANLRNVETWVASAAQQGADICVLPEMVDVSFGLLVQSNQGGDRAEPIPGPTTDELGRIARTYGVWLATAVLERVPHGVHDTSILIDERGRLVHRQRKGRLYPFLGGEVAYQGNYQDVCAASTPWGPIAVVNCADVAAPSKRSVIASQKPVLTLVSLSNPPASELQWLPFLALESRAPAVGANMVFPVGTAGGQGGESQAVDALGNVILRSTSLQEEVHVIAIDLPATPNRRPFVDVSDTQTIPWPQNVVSLRAYASDDGRPTSGLAFSWAQQAGPQNAFFTQPNALETDFVVSGPGVYVVRFAADDGLLRTFRDVSINVLPATGPDPNLVGHWTFDQQDATDASAYRNHGTLLGGPTFAAELPPGMTGFSLQFDGVDDCVRIPHHPSLDAARAVTIAAWYRLDTAPTLYPVYDPQYLVNKGQWTDGNYAMGMGWLYYLFGSDTAANYEMDCPSLDPRTLNVGAWHHATFVMDGARQEGRIYVDGVLDHCVRFQPDFKTNGNDVYLGVKEPSIGNWFHGYLDDVRIYTRCLTEDEVAALVPGAKPNRVPTLRAGADRTVFAGRPVFLDGVFLDDSVPATSFNATWVDWRKVRGPGRVWFHNPFRPDTHVDVEVPGVYEFELRGSDGSHRVYDTVRIQVLELGVGSIKRF
ncbi:MAG: hypothetical protein H6834_09845 [Planctomycetes bacterium]|nr:hypothetical protein [Planctomycetota bacterium]